MGVVAEGLVEALVGVVCVLLRGLYPAILAYLAGRNSDGDSSKDEAALFLVCSVLEHKYKLMELHVLSCGIDQPVLP